MIQLNHPYDEMMDSLAHVRGYRAFSKYINSGKNDERSIRAKNAEIKALFELKLNGYLQAITSGCATAKGKSSPEALLKIKVGDRTHKGIVEVKHIGWAFHEDDNKRKTINKELMTMQRNSYSTKVLPEIGVTIQRQPAGVITSGPSVDLNKKILHEYKRKRDQHKKTYPDFPSYLKLYYFFVNCPPHFLQVRDFLPISRKMKLGEVLYICATSRNGKELAQTAFGTVRGVDAEVVLTNPYYSDLGTTWIIDQR